VRKYKEKCIYVDIRAVEQAIQNLNKEIIRLRKQAEKARGKDRLMTAEQVAEYLGIHHYTVYQLVKNHGLPVIKLYPRVQRFDKEEIRKWMRLRSNELHEKKRLISERKPKQKQRDKEIDEARSKMYERRGGNGSKTKTKYGNKYQGS